MTDHSFPSATLPGPGRRDALPPILTVPPAVPSVTMRPVTLGQAQTVLFLDSTVDGLLDLVQVRLTCRTDVWPAQPAIVGRALDSMAVI